MKNRLFCILSAAALGLVTESALAQQAPPAASPPAPAQTSSQVPASANPPVQKQQQAPSKAPGVKDQKAAKPAAKNDKAVKPAKGKGHRKTKPPAPEKKPWQRFKLPAKKIFLDFTDANPDK